MTASKSAIRCDTIALFMTIIVEKIVINNSNNSNSNRNRNTAIAIVTTIRITTKTIIK